MLSSDVVIRVKNLSKCYQIYERPADRLKQFILPRLQRLFGLNVKQYFKEFWALNNVSFEIKKGQTLGIIGKNGSGKSTLLQLICGTLNPSGGFFFCEGKVAALLELGSGFNPEFTGRENIFMNAAVLGLTQEQTEDRYRDIVNFSGIEEFINQPVKTYSSGMLMRLAFSVIAHVDADVLIIDEALSVGDAVFTQKCMQYIRNFQKTGTLIFVSHDNGAVQSLCDHVIWLKHGQVEKSGEAKDVCEAYFQFVNQELYGSEVRIESLNQSKDSGHAPKTDSINYSMEASLIDNLEYARGWKTGSAELLSVDIFEVDIEGSLVKKDVFKGGELVRLFVDAKTDIDLLNPILGFQVADRLGQYLFGENTLEFTRMFNLPLKAGETFRGDFEFYLPFLPNGEYAIMASVADGNLEKHIQHHWVHDAKIISVSSSKVRYGLVGVPFNKVTLEKLNEEYP